MTTPALVRALGLSIRCCQCQVNRLFGRQITRQRHVVRFRSSQPALVHLSQEQSAPRLEIGQADSMLDIGIRTIFSDEHDVFRKYVRNFFEEEVVPYHAQWEEEGMVSREVWQKAGAQGLLGVNVPSEIGGIGSDFITAMIVHEEQYYANCTGIGFTTAADIVIPYLVHYGTPEQKEKFLPPMISGQWISAIMMSEPGAGSDLLGMKTNARQDGSDWILNGSKVFITNGYQCDVGVVAAVTDRSARSTAHGISLFLVEAGMKGFTKGRILNKLGIKGSDTAEVFFDDVRIPKENLLGEEANRGFYYLMSQLPQERLVIASWGQAHAEWMFEETRKYVNHTKATQKRLADSQITQHKLAEMKTDICLGRSFLDKCNKIHQQRGIDGASASMAKYWITAMQNRVIKQCVQIHDRLGITCDVPIARAYLDARAQMIYGGSNEIMKELIARSIVKDS